MSAYVYRLFDADGEGELVEVARTPGAHRRGRPSVIVQAAA